MIEPIQLRHSACGAGRNADAFSPMRHTGFMDRVGQAIRKLSK